MSQELTRERLMEVHSYDPVTGLFRWKINRIKHFVGRVAGRTNNRGYHCVRVDNHEYAAHRLAWLYVYGSFPTKDIDHIDLDKTNNAIANLREATKSQNAANRKCHNNSSAGLKGVSRWKGDRWRAFIMKDGKSHFLGMFSDKNEAHAAYCAAAKSLHGEYARVS